MSSTSTYTTRRNKVGQERQIFFIKKILAPDGTSTYATLHLKLYRHWIGVCFNINPQILNTQDTSIVSV